MNLYSFFLTRSFKMLAVLSVLCLAANVSTAQLEFNNIALSKGFILNVESEKVFSTDRICRSGQFAISDADGNLQLYGDASHIYDKDGAILYKCDIEHGFGSMSWVAMNPKDKKQFYVFNSYEKNFPQLSDYIVVSHFFVININDDKYSIDEKIVNTYRNPDYYDSYCHTSFVLRHTDGTKLWFVTRNEKEIFASYLIDDGEVVSTTISSVQTTDRLANDFSLAIKTNPQQNAVFLPNGKVLNFDNVSGELKINDKFKIPDDVVSFEFSQSGKYLYCAKKDDDYLTISRYYVSELEQGIAENEDVIYTEKLEMSGRTTLLVWMNLLRHPNSSIYIFCYNNYVSKLVTPDSSTPVFIPKAVELPSRLNSNIPFVHYIDMDTDLPCINFSTKNPRIICE